MPIRVENGRLIRPESVEGRIRKLILLQQPDIAAIIHPGAKFMEDLGLDSLDTAELVMKAEEEFGIEIHDYLAEQVSTVQDAVDLVMMLTKLEAQNA